MRPAQPTSGNGATGPEEPSAPPVARGFAVTDEASNVASIGSAGSGGAAARFGDDLTEDAPATRLKGPVVVAMIVVTALFVVAMVAIIYYRWVTTVEPTTAIIVQGDSTHDGATIRVSGNNTNVTSTLGATNDYLAPILVVPGTYTVTVEKDGRVIGKWDLVVERYRGSVLYLSREARDASSAAAATLNPE